jgi:hypothetical protein
MAKAPSVCSVFQRQRPNVAVQPIEELEEEQPEFNWTKCLHDQMFVFQEHDLDRILDIVITNMTPQRSPSQKPVPANMIFLGARYAHYHSSPELLAKLLITAMDKINDVVDRLIEEEGYCAVCANELLKYVGTLLSR